jgi:hypothetical protein
VPLRTYSFILQFKWRDWCASLDLEHNPVRMPLIWQGSLSPGQRVENTMKRGLAVMGMGKEHWALKPLIKTGSQGTELLAAALRMAAQARPCLSNTAVLDRQVDRLISRLQQLATDYGIGSPDPDSIGRALRVGSKTMP